MTCFMCKDDMEPTKETYIATLESCVIIIKNVPALVCNQCEEVYYTLEVARVLENIIKKLEGIIKEVAIVEYSGKGA